MIKELEELALKYQKISSYSIQLKQDNYNLANKLENMQVSLSQQIDNLQSQLTLMVEDKLKLEQTNAILINHLKSVKKYLSDISEHIHLEILENSSEFLGNYSKDTNGLYSSTTNLANAAAAAAAAIGIETATASNIQNDIETLSNTIQELNANQENIERIEIVEQAVTNENPEQNLN